MGRVAPPRERWTGHLVPSRIPPARPTWTAGESPRGFNPPPQCGGTCPGRRGWLTLGGRIRALPPPRSRARAGGLSIPVEEVRRSGGTLGDAELKSAHKSTYSIVAKEMDMGAEAWDAHGMDGMVGNLTDVYTGVYPSLSGHRILGVVSRFKRLDQDVEQGQPPIVIEEGQNGPPYGAEGSPPEGLRDSGVRRDREPRSIFGGSGEALEEGESPRRVRYAVCRTGSLGAPSPNTWPPASSRGALNIPEPTRSARKSGS